jgi:hypothetical protein
VAADTDACATTHTNHNYTQVPADVKGRIEERIAAVKAAVAKDSTEEIKATSEALQKEVMDMGAAMYQQGGAAAGAAPGAEAGGSSGSSSGSAGAGPGAAGGSSSGGSDGTIDAEFTDAK